MNAQLQPTHELVDGMIERWDQATCGESTAPPKLPVAILLGEAAELVELSTKHRGPIQSDGVVLPGLSSLESSGHISPTVIEEMRGLHLAAATVNARLSSMSDEPDRVVERARFILKELRTALAFLVETGAHPRGAPILARLRAQEKKSRAHGALAMLLDYYSHAAHLFRDELGALAGFDVALIDEALRASHELRLRAGRRTTEKVGRARRDMMRLRNRLLSALASRMATLRRAFRFLYRDHPTIVARATSQYHRERQRRLRGKSRKAIRANETAPLNGSRQTLDL